MECHKQTNGISFNKWTEVEIKSNKTYFLFSSLNDETNALWIDIQKVDETQQAKTQIRKTLKYSTKRANKRDHLQFILGSF